MVSLARRERNALRSIFGNDFTDDIIFRTARSIDASCYRLIPQAVVRPRHPGHIIELLKHPDLTRLPLTFRGAGTSLSGQAIGEGVLVEVGFGTFRDFNVLRQGAEIASGPGVIGGHLNMALSRYQRRIGPDPASIGSAMLGGILANNASGMCCGIQDNSYRTMKSLVFILADGLRLDSGDPFSEQVLREARPDLFDGLLEMRQDIMAKPHLCDRIKQKFSIKNTSGYAMNAFLDFDQPVDIAAHLMIGSEGTLGFIERAVMRTVEDPPFKSTSLLALEHIEIAAELAAKLGNMGASAVELLDATSLEAARRIGTLPISFGEIHENGAALLIEFQCQDTTQLQTFESALVDITKDLVFVIPPTSEPALRRQIWRMRKSLYPAVGGQRPVGNTMLIEDLCVKPEEMPDLIQCLRPLFSAYGLTDYVIFGHAKDGNLHFITHANLNEEAGVQSYADFMERVVELVVSRFDGSLKAEHGTGRNMAPFLEREWHSEIYSMMRRVKTLFDPESRLNPDVMINSDPLGHLKHLKKIKAVSEEIDACMDCGFCESVCPSRDFTVTPRQRIALVRHGGLTNSDKFNFAVDQSCAADGQCARACPISIDTGSMVKELRQEKHGRFSQRLALWMANHIGLLSSFARKGLGLANGLGRLTAGRWVLEKASRLTPYRLTANQRLPLPARPVLATQPTQSNKKPLIYFPTCVHAMLGDLSGEPAKMSVPEAVCDVLRTLDYQPMIPPDVAKLCCGTPFFSKGFSVAGDVALDQVRERLREVTLNGEIPIVVDVAPCTQTLKEKLGEPFQVLDLVEVLARHRERLPKWRESGIVLHPTCSMQAIKTDKLLRTLFEDMGADVQVPIHTGCCGFAGDRGLLVPELTAHATYSQTEEVKNMLSKNPKLLCVSSCKTCEWAMSQTSGLVYQSYIHSIQRHLNGVTV